MGNYPGPGPARRPALVVDLSELGPQYQQVRRQSEVLCAPLEIEDHCIQTMLDVSPPKWHLAHTTWFFETFILVPYQPGYTVYDERYAYLFNSYYETVGNPFPRPQRGLLSRPTVDQVAAYRAYVDEAMGALLEAVPEAEAETIRARTILGLHHEQQHQELLLTDIKHIFAFNPMRPAYHDRQIPPAAPTELEWIDYAGGIHVIGHGGGDFAFDNETPRHRVYLGDYALASRLVTNGEYMEFMEAGAYDKPDYWLSDGWATIRAQGWRAPLYWEQQDGRWWHMTLAGMQPVDEHAPVCHVSLYEADAYARWAGARLPSEDELELALARVLAEGNFSDDGWLQPLGADADQSAPRQLYGDVWEWTRSAYGPYPGFEPLSGSLGEYNGKFMSSQNVLRGGSCATPCSHIRSTYRNFFYPKDRWQFTGLRLGVDR